MEKVLIVSCGQSVKDRTDKMVRCRGCEYLHDNGNCLKVGGFCLAVSDKHCPKTNKPN